jgi:SAM-dependent methyltransferase
MSQEAAVPDQITYWNEEGGPHWVARQEAWDVTMKPISDSAFVRAGVEAGEWAIDIGCGCGATSLELAARVGRAGRVLGVDVSRPMLARAKERGQGVPQLAFAEADATVYPFEAGGYDLLFSRHGVMFFADPVAAFANLRRALKKSGRLAFSCFRTPKENPFITTAVAALAEIVPPPPRPGPEEPGPFAFADPARMQRILDAAGFTTIVPEPVDLLLDVGSGQGLDVAVTNALEIGPASRALAGQPPDVKARAADAIRKALAPHEKFGRILLPAGIWVVTAKNG